MIKIATTILLLLSIFCNVLEAAALNKTDFDEDIEGLDNDNETDTRNNR